MTLLRKRKKDGCFKIMNVFNSRIQKKKIYEIKLIKRTNDRYKLSHIERVH